MRFEVTKINENGPNEPVLDLSSPKVKDHLKNLYLDYGDSIWIETPGGTVRVALYDRISVAIYGAKGTEVDMRKGKGIKFFTEKD